MTAAPLRSLAALAGATVLAALGSVVLVPRAADAAPAAPTAGLTYVALGDSYAAGFGLPPSAGAATGLPVPGCAQTTGDYPHLLAAALGLALTDVTCSGATTADFAGPQTTGAGTAAPQLQVFDTVQPDLVTITIGGNDLGFSSIAASCFARSATGPLLLHRSYDTCADYFTTGGPTGGANPNPFDLLDDVVLPAVGDAIDAVHAAAPAAAIAVIAYPAIAPDAANTPAGGCYTANALAGPQPIPGVGLSVRSAFPFTDVDTGFLQELQARLDDGIGTVAAEHGAAYADIYAGSLAHSACSPADTRWVEPAIPADPTGFNVLHPNLAGTTAMAAALAPVVTTLLVPPSSPPATTGAPTGPGGPPVATPPLAATGPRAPVGWFVGIGVALIATGVFSLRLARYRARH